MTNAKAEGASEHVFLDGRIVPRDAAMVPAFDRGLLYGDGVFETMRSYGAAADAKPGIVFRLDDHLHRLQESARQLQIGLPLSLDQIADAVRKLIELNRLQDAYLRITLTRGRHTGSLALDTGRTATLLIDCRPLRAYPDEWYANGIRITASRSRRSRSALAPRHKCLSYVENILVLDEARRAGAQEALILTEEGYVCEGATSNIFWVAAGAVYTPSAEANLLSGVTRAVVIEICNRLGLQVNEGLFPSAELARADEVFITSSIMEIMPVAAADGRTVRHCPGEVTSQLRREYAAEVRRCVERARAR